MTNALRILTVFGVLMAGPALAGAPDDAGCTRCTSWAVNRALHTNRAIDCAEDVPRVLAARLDRAFARCRARRACPVGASSTHVLDAVRAGIDAIESRICRLTPSEDDPAAPSDVLRIRCLGGDGVEVLTPVVAAGPDGLRIETVGARPNSQVGVRAMAQPNTEYWSGSEDAREPFVRPLHTGAARVWCIDGPAQGASSAEAAFTLVDPAGHFVPYALECGDAGEHHLEADDWLVDQARSVEAAVRTFLRGLRPDDVVERAGYVGASADWPWLTGRVVRDGRVIGAIEVDGREGWQYHAYWGRVCDDSGLTSE